MKRIQNICTAIVFCIGSLIMLSCSNDNNDFPVPITDFSVSRTSADMFPNDTLRLTLKIEPDIYKDRDIKWTSSDTKVATVDSKGLVKAVAVGHATITAQLNTSETKTKIVVNPFIAVDSVLFSQKSYTALIGDSLKAEVKIYPENASLKSVKWAIANNEIAKINENGTITPLKFGKTEVIFNIQDKTFKTTLEVKEKIKFLNKNFDLLVGGKIFIDIDTNFTDYKKEILNVFVKDKSILLLTSDKSLIFTGIKQGKTELKLSTTHAEGKSQVNVIYPETLLPINMEFGISPEAVNKWEANNGGKPDGGMKYDEELWLNYQNYNVTTSPMQITPFRRYYFDEGKLNRSFILYPYTTCFEDRGGGMGNFNKEFVELLKKSGYSEPHSAGNIFISKNIEKKLTLLIEVQKMDGEIYFGLTFMKNMF